MKIRANSKGMSGHHRPNHGESVDWLTPPEILRALGPFDLDPCCPPVMPWKTAKHVYTEADDGLARPWFGRVWLNPPYGARELAIWLERLADHGNGIALVFARTETEAFFRHGWERADSMLFIRGRLHFHRLDGTRAAFNAGAPSVLIAYGEESAARLFVASILQIRGKYVYLADSNSVTSNALEELHTPASAATRRRGLQTEAESK